MDCKHQSLPPIPSLLACPMNSCQAPQLRSQLLKIPSLPPSLPLLGPPIYVSPNGSVSVESLTNVGNRTQCYVPAFFSFLILHDCFIHYVPVYSGLLSIYGMDKFFLHQDLPIFPFYFLKQKRVCSIYV